VSKQKIKVGNRYNRLTCIELVVARTIKGRCPLDRYLCECGSEKV